MSATDSYISNTHSNLWKPSYQESLRRLWGNYCVAEAGKTHSPDVTFNLSLRSFLTAFSGLTDTLKAFRYVTTDISPLLGISCFEEGLFLDFILFSIDQLQLLLSIDQQEIVPTGHSMYQGMIKGSATSEIMYDRFHVENTNKLTGRKEKIVSFSKADQIHLEHFYAEIGNNLPTLRRSNTTITERYRFSTMGRLFPHTDRPADLLRNFYFREKYWSVNFAALLYSLNLNDIPSQSHKRYYEILEDLDSEYPHTITSLMRIPSPIYRFTFLHTAINEYLNNPMSGSLASLSWAEFLDKCCLPPLVNAYLEGKGICFTPGTLNNLFSLSFWLMLVPWMDIHLLHCELKGTSPSSSQLKQMIFERNLLSNLSNDLCELACQQLSTLSGFSFQAGCSKALERWPLLLIPNKANPKVEELLSYRTPSNRGERGDNAEKYTSIQAKCCRSHYNTHI